MKKNTYIIAGNDHGYIRNLKELEQKDLQKIVKHCKDWVEEVIKSTNITPLSEKVLNSFVCLDICNGLEDYSQINYRTSTMTHLFVAHEGFKSFLHDDRQREIKESLEIMSNIKRTISNIKRTYDDSSCFFVDITNKETGLNKILPLSYEGLCNITSLIFTDKFINNEPREIEEGASVIFSHYGNREEVNKFYKKGHLLFFDDIYENYKSRNCNATVKTFINAIRVLGINSQEEVRNIVVNKIIDFGYIDSSDIQPCISNKIPTLKPSQQNFLQLEYEKEETIEKHLSYDESLGLYNEMPVSLSEINQLSNEYLDILENGYEEFKTLRFINTIQTQTKGLKLVKDYDYDYYAMLKTSCLFYCKKCKKNSHVPEIMLYKNDYINTFKCPLCGAIHEIGNNDTIDNLEFLNATVFDEIETENKVKFRTRLSRYTRSRYGIYYESFSYGFTYNLDTKRAYVYSGKNGKHSNIADISAVDFSTMGESLLVYATDIFIDKNGNEIKKIDRLKECFNTVYDLLSTKIEIPFTKKEILKIAKKSLVKSGSYIISRVYENSPYKLYEKDDEEYQAYVDRYEDCEYEIDEKEQMQIFTQVYVASMKILGEVLKNPSITEEAIIVGGVCNNSIANYVRRASKRNGRYLTNKFGMSNALRKAIIKKPWKINNYILFKDLIKDTNNMLKLFELDITKNTMKRFVMDLTRTPEAGDVWAKNLKMIDTISEKFEEKLRPLKDLYGNESLFVNRLISNDEKDLNYYLLDTCYMLEQVLIANQDFNFSSKFKITRLHDELSSAQRKIKNKNKTIKYDGDEKNLAYEDEEFKVTLAQDTHTLIDLGSKLNICVGSYGDRAYEKRCTILYVMDKTQDYKEVCCIELRKLASSFMKDNEVEFEVIQTKANSNHRPEGNLRKFLLTWIKEYSLNLNTNDIRFKDVQLDEVAAELDVERALF